MSSTDVCMAAPTDKQLKVIGYIEWNLQDCGVKFTGTTKRDAQKFISDHIEESRRVRHEAALRIASARTEQELYDFIYGGTSERHNTTTCADLRRQKEEARRKRYEEYIEDASWAYANDANDDGFGGFAADRMARQAMPYDEFCRWHDWGD